MNEKNINEKKTKKSNIWLNILLGLILVSSITYFILILIYKENNINFIFSLISSLILTIFSCFFVITELTNPSKNKSKIYITGIIFLIYLGFTITSSLNILTLGKVQRIKDFTNKSLTEVIEWSKYNHVDIKQVYEYSDLIDEYNIIYQDQPANTLLKDIKTLTIMVSEGPNPDKEIILPNMLNWDSEKVLKYLQENHLNNIDVSFVKSDKLKNTLIEQNITGTTKRSSQLKLVFSLGENIDNENVKLIDLKNKTELEAIFFLKQNSINYKIKKEFSNTVKRNKIIKTNIKPGTILKHNQEVEIIISKGPEIKVPNLKDYSMEKITEWIIKNKLKLEFSDKYDDNIKENHVISVNYNEGDKIEEKTLIKLVVSKGKLVMESFENVDEFKTWANKYNINYEEKFEFNTEVKSGDVISYSHKKGDTIKNNDTVIITISQGSKTKVPNLIGKQKSTAINLLEQAKLKYNFVYEASTKSKNTVIKQSLSANNEVAENTTITLTLSNGKKPSSNERHPSYNNNRPSNNGNNNQSNNNNNSNNNNIDKPVVPTCDPNIKQKIYIYDELLSSIPATTCSNIKRAYPKFKFSCTYRNNGMSPGLLLNSNEIDNHSFNFCNTINLVITSN